MHAIFYEINLMPNPSVHSMIRRSATISTKVRIQWHSGLGFHLWISHGCDFSRLGLLWGDNLEGRDFTRRWKWTSGIAIDDPTRRPPSQITQPNDPFGISTSS